MYADSRARSGPKVRTSLIALLVVWALPFYDPTPCTATNLESQVTFLMEVHFAAPEGGDVVISPGTYRLEPQAASLNLVPVDGGAAHRIAAERTTHNERVSKPIATVDAGIGDEDSEYLYIALFLPGGERLETMGSTSGVATRGKLRNALKNRPRPLRNAWENRPRPIHDKIVELMEATKREAVSKGFEPVNPDQGWRDYERLTDAPSERLLVDVPAPVILQPNSRTTLAPERIRFEVCRSARFSQREKSDKLSTFGQCRLYLEPDGTDVKMLEYVTELSGSATQSYDWISPQISTEKSNTADLTLTIGVTGKLVAYGVGSRALIEIHPFLESRVRKPPGEWVPEAAPTWGVTSSPEYGGVGVDAGPWSIGISGPIPVPTTVDEDVVFILNDVQLREGYDYRVRVNVQAEATTGLKVVATVASVNPFFWELQHLFVTRADFRKSFRNPKKKDRGLSWDTLVITTD